MFFIVGYNLFQANFNPIDNFFTINNCNLINSVYDMSTLFFFHKFNFVNLIKSSLNTMLPVFANYF